MFGLCYKEMVKERMKKCKKNYISYFQSVTTVGVISSGTSHEEAEKESVKKFKNSDYSCGIVGQTPFEVSDTEEWNPDFSFICGNDGEENLVININDKLKSQISKKIKKKDANSDDCLSFIKKAVESSL